MSCPSAGMRIRQAAIKERSCFLPPTVQLSFDRSPAYVSTIAYLDRQVSGLASFRHSTIWRLLETMC